MALNFPNNQADGATWEDDCGDIWVYNKDNNSWAKPVSPDFGESPFVRNAVTKEISPRVSGDYLDMTPGRIDISQYPDA
jgi:hypothetical protein